MKLIIASALFVACVIVLGPAMADDVDDIKPVVIWNEQLLAVAEAEDGFLTLKGLRTAAMMHIAMHDALNSIDGGYKTFLQIDKASGADPMAAMMEAAYTVAVAQYPQQQEQWQTLRSRWSGHKPDDDAAARGRSLGRSIAAAILTSRDGDRWNGEAEYQWHPMAPGVYAEFNEHSGTPEGFIFGAGWAKARPFVLESYDQFRSPPPPPIESQEYVKAFNEVKEVGRLVSKPRTEDQTHLALWWKDFVENSHNRLARDLSAKHKLDLNQAVRLFALLNMSVYDAYINVFDNKFHYNHWRPYTAIRWAEHDGNPATKAEAGWNNTHQHTYAFPSYPSAHGTACTAAMTVLEDTFGEGFAFTMYTPAVDVAGPFSGKMEMQPATRSFSSFADAAMECSLSRVYLGIHFRYDSVEGNILGRRIGEYVVHNALTPR